MAFPVSHIIVPMILADLYRRYIAKKKFSYYWILLAGFAGLMPDFDLFVGAAMKYSPLNILDWHRSWSHSVFIVLGLLILGLIVYAYHRCFIKNNKKTQANLRFARILRNVYFAVFIITFGIATHILFDIINGHSLYFFPFGWSGPSINYCYGSDDVCATWDGIFLIVFLITQERVWEPLIGYINSFLGRK